MFSRRAFLAGSLAATAFGPAAFAQENVISEAAVLRDPAIPVTGNPNGDITIVEFSDYQCPYCKKAHPDLLKAVRGDGNIRLVFKIWPLFGPASVYAGQMALAARTQKKFAEAHSALMSMNDRLSEATADTALAAAGIDVNRAKKDLRDNIKEIGAVLKRNHTQADALGFQGTPSFIIGKFRVPGALTEEMFRQAVADARKALKG
jgi:protein-disulfide isomerase